MSDTEPISELPTLHISTDQVQAVSQPGILLEQMQTDTHANSYARMENVIDMPAPVDIAITTAESEPGADSQQLEPIADMLIPSLSDSEPISELPIKTFQAQESSHSRIVLNQPQVDIQTYSGSGIEILIERPNTVDRIIATVDSVCNPAMILLVSQLDTILNDGNFPWTAHYNIKIWRICT